MIAKKKIMNDSKRVIGYNVFPRIVKVPTFLFVY